ncbi:Zn-finger containing protein [Clostridium tetani 12124569]|nr:Zn-finger containing protein [Clostridium tetani 12124569]
MDAFWKTKSGSSFAKAREDISLDALSKSIKAKIKERREFLILRCPNCSQKLRLPRKKGNILVTCPRCIFKFKSKT